MDTEFDRTTAVVPVAGRPGEFSVELDAGWSALAGVHGGYMCALAVRGAELAAPGRTVRTMTASFLRPGRVGPATLVVGERRQGRSFTTMDVDLVQQDRVVATSRLTLMAERSGIEWGERRPLDLAPPQECVEFQPPAEVISFGRFELRFDPERMPFTDGRTRLAGYVRPREPRAIDAAWLVMAADCFPPPAFARSERPLGGVSIDLAVHVHRNGLELDEGEWLAGSFEIHDSTGGLAVEHGRITLIDGTVVAESFHTRLTALG